MVKHSKLLIITLLIAHLLAVTALKSDIMKKFLTYVGYAVFAFIIGALVAVSIHVANNPDVISFAY